MFLYSCVFLGSLREHSCSRYGVSTAVYEEEHDKLFPGELGYCRPTW